jgi:hypothetical protein
MIKMICAGAGTGARPRATLSVEPLAHAELAALAFCLFRLLVPSTAPQPVADNRNPSSCCRNLHID